MKIIANWIKKKKKHYEAKPFIHPFKSQVKSANQFQLTILPTFIYAALT